MKKLLVVLVLSYSATLFSQSAAKDDVAIVQSLYGKSKTEMVDLFMALTESQKAAFQPIYDDYESARKALGREKFDLIYQYAENYGTFTDEKADQIASQVLKNNLDLEKLYSKTYKKAKKVIGAKNAAKFLQLEIYFQTMVRSEVQDAIPFIDELEKSVEK